MPKELFDNNLCRFRRIFFGGQGSGTAVYSVLHKVTLTQPSGKKTRKVYRLLLNSS